MPAKTPIYLKPATDRKGRRLKLRDVLSGDMISPPLGDVKHSAHVGPQGEADMFGDVAFLQGKINMLPSLSAPQNGHGCSSGQEHPRDLSLDQDTYSSHCQQLRSTTSLPLFMVQEQAPPKPPRLHLDPPPHHRPGPHPHMDAPSHHGLAHNPHTDNGSALHSHLDPRPHHRSLSSPQPQSLNPSVGQLMPSSGSFSEGSSEDSLSDTCGPLEVPRGLSLDSDAGLSNEDLRSERSESPCSPLHPSALAPVTRSDSIMGGLDLDLGPSIMDDVLSIMDRYKGADHRCEL